MEINKLINLPRRDTILEDVFANNILPDDNCKHVAKNAMVMLSKLPLGRQNALGDFQDHADNMMRAYFINIFQELAEIRYSLRDLSPVLKRSQKRVQGKILSYARNHTPISKQAREFFPGKMQHEDEDSRTLSVLKRLLHIVLRLTVPFYHSTNWPPSKKKSANKIEKEFHAFYVINGVSFRAFINRATIRCERLERSLGNIKDQLRHPTSDGNDGVAGVAFQLRIPREQMARWRRDVECTLHEVRRVRRMFGLLPTHHCWQAIFNILTRQTNFYHFF